MAYEERNAWVYSVATLGAGLFYLWQLLAAEPALPFEARAYQWPMQLSIGGAILASIAGSILVNIVAGMVTGDTDTHADRRDREIGRFSDHVGQSLVILGAVVALGLAMLEVHSFWIAQALYVGFVLSGLLSGVARIGFYRFGFAP